MFQVSWTNSRKHPGTNCLVGAKRFNLFPFMESCMRSFSVSDCREVRDDVFTRFMQENPLSQMAVDGLVSINFTNNKIWERCSGFSVRRSLYKESCLTPGALKATFLDPSIPVEFSPSLPRLANWQNVWLDNPPFHPHNLPAHLWRGGEKKGQKLWNKTEVFQTDF